MGAKTKVCRLQSGMGSVRITEDSSVRLYMSCLPEKEAERTADKVFRTARAMAAAAFIMVPVAKVFCHLAYLERGFNGAGGEWMLIVLLYMWLVKILK